MKYLSLILALMLVFAAGCSTELGHQDHDHDGDGVQDHTAEEHVDEEMGISESDQDADKLEHNVEVNTYVDVNAAEAKELIDENDNLIVIDVSPHYDEGHLPGAVHYYLGDGSLERAIPTLDPEAEYLVYCHVDSVAIRGAQMLIDAGFTTVYRLEGNYGAWKAAGYPLEK